MSKRLSDIAGSLRQLGEIQVADWDLRGLLNKDIHDLEIGRSLRKLGNKKVIDWDFSVALPAVHEFVHQEVDVVGWVKRAASYRVMEWDFRSTAPDDGKAAPEVTATLVRKIPGPEEIREVMARLRSFLHFVTMALIDEPDRARIRMLEIAPGVVRFQLVVAQKDLKILVGLEGATASAIRNLMKGTAAGDGVHVLLEILSHEEEMERSLRQGR